jgi:23S rRNA pseudouridine1911/1915/1917 synthase
MSRIEREATVATSEAGQRLDQAAGTLFNEFSRARLQRWIRAGELTLNGAAEKPRDKVQAGDRLRLAAVPEPEDDWQAADIDLDLVYEDDALLVVNKPPGLVVHPAAGHHDDTMLNGLLARWPELAALPRAGIVHRLDKDTSGLLVVARTLAAHKALVAALQARDVHREYQAIVHGTVISGGTVDEPVGRHPRNRQKMAVTGGGKHAVTHYRLIERFRAHSHLRLILETGRTHQIRVHLAHLGFPIVGDPAYGGRARLPARAGSALVEALGAMRRQALHAWRLSLEHPSHGEPCRWEAPLPADMVALLEALRADLREQSG